MPDAPALVAPEVDDHAHALVGDQLHGRVELHAAVAAQRPEHVAGEALAVHPDQHVLLALQVALDQRHVLLAVEHALEHVGGEVAPLGGDPGLGDPAHQLLVLPAVADQVGDGDHEQPVLGGEATQLGLAGHAHLLVVDDLAEDAGRVEPGHAGQVDGGLGVAGALEHAAPRGLRAGGCDRAGPGRRGGWRGRRGPGRWPSGRRRRCRSWCRAGSRRSPGRPCACSRCCARPWAAGRARRHARW